MKTGSKKTNSNKKHRCFELENQTQYIAHLINCPEDDVPIALAKMLDGLGCVENYALILHDKDFDDKGEPAEPHVHCVMEFKYPITITTISNHLGIEPQYFELIKQKKPWGHAWVTDIGGGLSYLTHRNVTNKHVYSDDEVIANAGWDWKAERNKSEEIQRKLKVEDIIQGIISGEIQRYNLSEHIDEHLYINSRRMIEAAFEYRKMIAERENDRRMECIFISGKSGTGKTTLAKDFAKSIDTECFISGGSNDPFQGYAGQKVIVIDDARPNLFSAAEWLKITDNHTSSLVHARYHNVKLDARYLIVTSIMTIEQFFKESFPKEEVTQFYRRFKTVIEVNHENILFYEYSKTTNHHELVMMTINPMSYRFDNKLKDDGEDVIGRFVSLTEQESSNIERSMKGENIYD